jgi:hypothetical protein
MAMSHDEMERVLEVLSTPEKPYKIPAHIKAMSEEQILARYEEINDLIVKLGQEISALSNEVKIRNGYTIDWLYHLRKDQKDQKLSTFTGVEAAKTDKQPQG